LKVLAVILVGLGALSIPPSSQPNSITQVAIIDNDDRITVSEYAVKHHIRLEDVYRKFGATGVLSCGNQELTANIVLRSDMLVTNAHAFIHLDKISDKCIPVEDLSACFFQKSFEGEDAKRYYIDPSTLKIPLTNCPRSTSKDAGSDIAFVRLKEPVLGIEPYSVFDGDERYEKDNFEDQPMTKVSTVNDRFRNFPPRTMSINDGCIIDQLVPGTSIFSLASNCSTDEGNSGGGNFFVDGDRPPILFGVTAATSPRESDGKPFGSNNFSLSAPLRGKVLDLIRAEAARR
jgi:hypothetical protein